MGPEGVRRTRAPMRSLASLLLLLASSTRALRSPMVCTPLLSKPQLGCRMALSEGSERLAGEPKLAQHDDEEPAGPPLWVGSSEALGGYSLRSFAGLLSGAALTGALTGLGVATFKASVAMLAGTLYGEPAVENGMAASDAAVLPWYTFFIPAAGGLAVAVLRAACGPEGLGPNLAGHVAEMTSGKQPQPVASVSRTAAAVATLGSGCSLGPEGPAVEWGMFTSRTVEQLLEAPVLGANAHSFDRRSLRIQRLDSSFCLTILSLSERPSHVASSASEQVLALMPPKISASAVNFSQLELPAVWPLASMRPLPALFLRLKSSQTTLFSPQDKKPSPSLRPPQVLIHPWHVVLPFRTLWLLPPRMRSSTSRGRPRCR